LFIFKDFGQTFGSGTPPFRAIKNIVGPLFLKTGYASDWLLKRTFLQSFFLFVPEILEETAVN
jgi:hypothetical protein